MADPAVVAARGFKGSFVPSFFYPASSWARQVEDILTMGGYDTTNAAAEAVLRPHIISRLPAEIAQLISARAVAQRTIPSVLAFLKQYDAPTRTTITALKKRFVVTNRPSYTYVNIFTTLKDSANAAADEDTLHELAWNKLLTLLPPPLLTTPAILSVERFPDDDELTQVDRAYKSYQDGVAIQTAAQAIVGDDADSMHLGQARAARPDPNSALVVLMQKQQAQIEELTSTVRSLALAQSSLQEHHAVAHEAPPLPDIYALHSSQQLSDQDAWAASQQYSAAPDQWQVAAVPAPVTSFPNTQNTARPPARMPNFSNAVVSANNQSFRPAATFGTRQPAPCPTGGYMSSNTSRFPASTNVSRFPMQQNRPTRIRAPSDNYLVTQDGHQVCARHVQYGARAYQCDYRCFYYPDFLAWEQQRCAQQGRLPHSQSFYTNATISQPSPARPSLPPPSRQQAIQGVEHDPVAHFYETDINGEVIPEAAPHPLSEHDLGHLNF